MFLKGKIKTLLENGSWGEGRAVGRLFWGPELGDHGKVTFL